MKSPLEVKEWVDAQFSASSYYSQYEMKERLRNECPKEPGEDFVTYENRIKVIFSMILGMCKIVTYHTDDDCYSRILFKDTTEVG